MSRYTCIPLPFGVGICLYVCIPLTTFSPNLVNTYNHSLVPLINSQGLYTTSSISRCSHRPKKIKKKCMHVNTCTCAKETDRKKKKRVRAQPAKKIKKINPHHTRTPAVYSASLD